MPDPYKSCRYIEGGLSFSYSDVRACAVLQNSRGRPVLQSISDTRQVDFDLLEQKKRVIRALNQTSGYAECQGCPHLTQDAWPANDGKLNWIGITNYVLCNVLCTYCWLNTADYSPMKAPKSTRAQLYSIATLIDRLIDEDRLSPNPTIDWGGGGEPTLSPDFGYAFSRLKDFGAVQWLHTNAVRFPRIFQGKQFEPGSLLVLCSLDAGTRDTYARIKQRDRFDRVIANLKQYSDIGATVVLKYIAVEENASAADADAFVQIARALGGETVVIDIDHRFPYPSRKIVATLRRIRRTSQNAGITCRFAAVGSNSAPKWLVDELQTRPVASQHDSAKVPKPSAKGEEQTHTRQ